MPPVHVLLQLRPQSRETFELILTLLPAAEGRLLIPGRERGILPIHCHAAGSTHARACLHANMHCSQMLFSMYCNCQGLQLSQQTCQIVQGADSQAGYARGSQAMFTYNTTHV